MRNKKRTTATAMLVTGLLTIVSGFALESTASAAEVLSRAGKELTLKPAHQGAAWGDFVGSRSDCKDAETPEGYPYLWHFVVPDFPVKGTPDVIAIQTAFSGVGAVNGGHVVQSGKGWNVYTANAGTLLDATGDSSAANGILVVMNLSHTCGPTQTTTTSTSTTNTGTTNTSTTNTGTTNTSTTNTSTTNTATTATSTTATATTATSTTATATTATSTTGTAAILPTEVTRAPSSTVDVSGVVVTQGANTLPRTGFDPGILLMLGGMLVVSGVLMLRYSDDQATA